MTINSLLEQEVVQGQIRALADSVVLRQFDDLLAKGQLDRDAAAHFNELLDGFERPFVPFPADVSPRVSVIVLESGVVEVELPLFNEDPDYRDDLFLRVHLTTDADNSKVTSLKAYAIVG